jgi:dimethylhistidine N-methyltransferase
MQLTSIFPPRIEAQVVSDGSDRVEASMPDVFRHDVMAGLSSFPKIIPSRWLYDMRGSELFEQITALPEYYPTRTETSILSSYASEIAEFASPASVLVEYGAGAGVKTRLLLDALEGLQAYVPVDIAGDFLEQAVERLSGSYPHVAMKPVIADFTSSFAMPEGLALDGRRLAFFPGSTIGNLTELETVDFLSMVREHVGTDGAAAIGFDLIKDVGRLIAAYDDEQGVTAAFNLNILERINRELGGSFPVGRFQHEAWWNPAHSSIEMHLVSLDNRVVHIDGNAFSFRSGESIRTEISRKFDTRMIASLAYRSGWRVDRTWVDADKQFAVVGLLARS